MKKNYEQYKKMLRTLLCGILIFSQTAVFAYVWLTNYNSDIVLPFVQKGNWLLYTLYAIISITFLRAFDCTKYGRYRKTNIIPSQMLAAFFTAVVTYLQIVLLSAEFVSVIPLIQMFFVDVAIIFVLTVSGDFMFDKIFPAKKVLLLYDNYSPDVFIRKLKSRKDKFVVDEIMNISVGIDELKEAIKDAESVILYDLSAEIRNKLLKICFEYDIRTYSTTKVSDVLVRGAECIHLFDTPLLLYRNIGLTFEQHVIKRAMDIVIASIMLVLSSPFLLISAIAIKLYDGGPVFFTQARYTLNGKIFKIHKFRSMIVDAEKNGTPIPSTKGDPRITPVGKVLRATRLDELPQLIDILVGNMSLVGPRPERIEHV
ncbi:MAG: sugar transferase, partial [Clostridia bacterium]|nr:sugar transferase [Clostridia bacterium]